MHSRKTVQRRWRRRRIYTGHFATDRKQLAQPFLGAYVCVCVCVCVRARARACALACECVYGIYGHHIYLRYMIL